MDDEADTTPLPAPTSLAVRPDTGTPGPVWDALATRAAHYATRARGDGTRRTYRSAWTHFSAWCADLGREPLSGDADLVAMYIVRRADDGLAVSSIRVALAAIRTAHLLAGIGLDLSQPRFRMTLEGVVRSRGVRPTRQAAPAVPDILAKCWPPSPSLSRHSESATGPCCSSASVRRCGAPSWSACGSATSPAWPGAASPFWCSARRQTSTGVASKSPSGPTRPSRCSARPQHSSGG